MARTTLEAWLPEEYTSQALQIIDRGSAVEQLARKIPMGSDTIHVPRSGAAAPGVVAKGTAYPEDASVNDDVLLYATKIAEAFRIAEEDISDSIVDVINVKKNEWAAAYSVFIDNATLAVTAASNGIGGTVPFTSVYRALSQTNATTAYTANANVIKTAGALTYTDLSDLLSIYENSPYWNEAKGFIIAHPSFKGLLRGILNTQGDPIFVENAREGSPDSLFGHPVKWSLGAKTSATATSNPSGNPILIIGNTDFLMLGVRSPVESVLIDGFSGVSALTDEAILKVRVRRGFTIGHEKAFGLLEITAA